MDSGGGKQLDKERRLCMFSCSVMQGHLLVSVHRLCIMLRGYASVCYVLALIGMHAYEHLRILPETLRAIVGDGSIQPHALYRPLLPIIGRKKVGTEQVERPPKRPFQNPLRLFLYPDVTILLLYNGVLYAVFYGITASISTLFSDTYPFLSETDIGLCFLAIGGGMLFGSWITGTVLDREYQNVKRRLERKCREDPECKIRLEDVTKDENFPIEYARFRTMPAYFVVYVACCAGYGWCLQEKVNIAGPLILQIVSEYSSLKYALLC
jgi:hypothetical protein